MIYAILKKDGSGIVKGVSQLAGVVSDPLMVEIPDYDESLIGKKYQGGKFVESGIAPPEPKPDPIAEIKASLAELTADVKAIKDDVAAIKTT